MLTSEICFYFTEDSVHWSTPDDLGSGAIRPLAFNTLSPLKPTTVSMITHFKSRLRLLVHTKCK